MKNDILFSIVVPTYNRADLIMETLESIFDQTYTLYEILVIDNCSTDDTEELLRPLANTGKIRYIRHEKNYERSKSRNTGMYHAKGDFLTFLDSDDFMYKNCLKDAATYALQHPEIKFFHNLYELVDNNKKKIYSYDFPPLSNQYKSLACGNFISCIGGFISREIYSIYQFNEDVRMVGSEDYEVWFEIMAKYKRGRINKINCGIREHVQRSVNNGAYLNLEYQKHYLINKIKNNKILFEKFGTYLKRLNTSFLLQQAIISSKMGKKKQSLQLLAQALALNISVFFTKRFIKVLFNSFKK